jgi:hypothetical protein
VPGLFGEDRFPHVVEKFLGRVGMPNDVMGLSHEFLVGEFRQLAEGVVGIENNAIGIGNGIDAPEIEGLLVPFEKNIAPLGIEPDEVLIGMVEAGADVPALLRLDFPKNLRGAGGKKHVSYENGLVDMYHGQQRFDPDAPDVQTAQERDNGILQGNFFPIFEILEVLGKEKIKKIQEMLLVSLGKFGFRYRYGLEKFQDFGMRKPLSFRDLDFRANRFPQFQEWGISRWYGWIFHNFLKIKIASVTHKFEKRKYSAKTATPPFRQTMKTSSK